MERDTIVHGGRGGLGIGAHDVPVTSPPIGQDRRPVPVRTILATIGLLLATALVVYVLVVSRHVITWIVVGDVAKLRPQLEKLGMPIEVVEAP